MENVVCLSHLLHLFVLLLAYLNVETNSVAQIRLPLQEQSDMGLHRLSSMLLKHFNRRKKSGDIVVNGALRVKGT